MCFLQKSFQRLKKHIIASSHYLQQVLLLKKICEESFEKITTSNSIKKGCETHFHKKEKPEQIIIIIVHKLLFFISQDGLPDENNKTQENTKQHEVDPSAVFYWTKSDLCKKLQSAKSRTYLKFPIIMRFGVGPEFHQIPLISMYPFSAPGEKQAKRKYPSLSTIQ